MVVVSLVFAVAAFHPTSSAATPKAGPAAATPGSGADFNGDGFADLAVFSNENVGQAEHAGGINVLYGTATGLKAAGDQLWSQDSPGIRETAEEFEDFGGNLATGDFDGDGFSDLVASVPGEGVAGFRDAGAVAVLYGSKDGLSADGNQLWNQNTEGLPGHPAEGTFFGWSLAVGNFGRGSQDDLAIGAYDKVGRVVRAGSVTIIYGSTGGLSSTGSHRWSQDTEGVLDKAEGRDAFGIRLAAGNFGRGSQDDLVVGVPLEDVGPEGTEVHDSGLVHVLYGSATGLTADGNQVWSQDSGSIQDDAEFDDQFGLALAVGEFGRGPQDDLAVGVPHEDSGAQDSGVVQVLYATNTGLASDGNLLFAQGAASGLQDVQETNDYFGLTLVAGDFGQEAQQDLAIGIPLEDVGAVDDAGMVAILYADAGGLEPDGNQLWGQDVNPDLEDHSEPDDLFGYDLAVGNYGKDGHDDLAVGVPHEGPPVQSGVVQVIYSDGAFLNAPGNEEWSQVSTNVEGFAEESDHFGTDVA